MRTVEKIRFSVAAQKAVRSAISDEVGFELWELDTNAPIRLGSFSKARTKVGGFYDAIAACKALREVGCKSDLLLRRHDWTKLGYGKNGWQVWERRRHTGRRVPTVGGGSRMPKTSCGEGKIYML